MVKIAIDFDGVINTVKESEPGEFGDIVFGARDAIESFLKDGFEVIIYTARSDIGNVKRWLRKNDFPELEVTNKKVPSCSIYVDDRGYRFREWNQSVIDEIKSLAKETKEEIIESKPIIGYRKEFFKREANKEW